MGGGRDKWVEGVTDGRREGQMGGGRDRWVEGGTDGHICVCSCYIGVLPSMPDIFNCIRQLTLR